MCINHNTQVWALNRPVKYIPNRVCIPLFFTKLTVFTYCQFRTGKKNKNPKTKFSTMQSHGVALILVFLIKYLKPLIIREGPHI